MAVSNPECALTFKFVSSPACDPAAAVALGDTAGWVAVAALAEVVLGAFPPAVWAVNTSSSKLLSKTSFF